MRDPLNKTITTIQPSGIRKFFDVVHEMKDAISLGVGEPDFDTPWHIRDEGIYSLEKGRTFYTSNAGLKELREEIVRYLERRIHVSYDPLREVLITVGGSEGIDMAFRAMLNPGDEVLIPQPSYVSYEPCCVLADGVPVIIELKEENEFRLTARELRDAITDKTKILVLPFPNNPTGAQAPLAFFEQAVKLAVEQLVRNSGAQQPVQARPTRFTQPAQSTQAAQHTLATQPDRATASNPNAQYSANGEFTPQLAMTTSDPAVMHDIAQYAPDLHVYLVQNPYIYPELLNWLASLNETEVNEAIAARRAR